jgi:hypothetical protein
MDRKSCQTFFEVSEFLTRNQYLSDEERYGWKRCCLKGRVAGL